MIDALSPAQRIPKFCDVAAKEGVQIEIRHDGLVIWINVDGVCVARILTNGHVPIEIEDKRDVKST